jgi:flagellar biosynthesis GTPase FlhF|tara:strand:+ start:3597 stop:4373 length:777 start_codon:yes stop_codon:yes gene_type:complete
MMSDAAPDIGHNDPPSPVLEGLRETYEKELARASELTIAFSRAPESVDDEETAGKVGDFIKQFTAVIKSGKAAHKAEKEPYLTNGRIVDNFFKANLIEPMEKLKTSLVERITVYERAKADEERRIREAAEREAREAAEEAARKAAEAEAAMESEEDVDAALVAAEEAEEAQVAARKAAEDADATNADLSRTRGQRGSVASLRTVMKGELVSREKLDLEALRQHLSEDALEKAIRSFVKVGGKELAGARIYEDQQAVVR